MNIDRDAVRRAVLAVTDEDYYGLYEVVWYLRANHMKGASDNDLIKVAREIVRSLLDDGRVRLVQFRLTPREVQLIDPGAIDRILERDESWKPPATWNEPYPSLDSDAKLDQGSDRG